MRGQLILDRTGKDRPDHNTIGQDRDKGKGARLKSNSKEKTAGRPSASCAKARERLKGEMRTLGCCGPTGSCSRSCRPSRSMLPPSGPKVSLLNIWWSPQLCSSAASTCSLASSVVGTSSEATGAPLGSCQCK